MEKLNLNDDKYSYYTEREREKERERERERESERELLTKYTFFIVGLEDIFVNFSEEIFIIFP